MNSRLLANPKDATEMNAIATDLIKLCRLGVVVSSTDSGSSMEP